MEVLSGEVNGDGSPLASNPSGGTIWGVVNAFNPIVSGRVYEFRGGTFNGGTND